MLCKNHVTKFKLCTRFSSSFKYSVIHCSTCVPKRLTCSPTGGRQDLSNKAVDHPSYNSLRSCYRQCLGRLIKYLCRAGVQLRLAAILMINGCAMTPTPSIRVTMWLHLCQRSYSRSVLLKNSTLGLVTVNLPAPCGRQGELCQLWRF